MNQFEKKLELLRAAMKEKGIHSFIIPSSDPHLGEDIPDHWRIIPWLTGFTGSSGTVVITDSFAGLWTDSRYFIQAERQLSGSPFEFVKPMAFKRNDHLDFLFDKLETGSKIGIDGRLHSVRSCRRLSGRLEDKKVSVETDCDLITELWAGRPALPFSLAFDHPVEFSGRGREVKIREVREQLASKKADYQLLTSPDDIMWLLNIRGNDLPYTPLLLSYALVGQEQILLFIDDNKIPPAIAAEFDRLGIVLLPYEETEGIVSKASEGSVILLDPATTSVALYNSVSNRMKVIEDISIPSRLKAVKNRTEIENIGKVMVKDGVALTEFFFWLENNTGKASFSDTQLAGKITEFRSRQKDFLGPSFAPIIAFDENSALPHYFPEEEAGLDHGERGILLVDSGGQYMGGTTDITRTIAVGIPSSQQKRDFTLVLKGHINLAMAKFPSGTRGYQLDYIAHRSLWDSGMNYAHGTGHGVGYCLNVHEGPQAISPADIKTGLESGMLTSNEPAIYREGKYGIRTENLILCLEDEETEFGQFLRFETVSLCYLDTALIDRSLLDEKEIGWLNSYHSEVYDKLSPYLTDEQKLWLKEKTELI